MSRILGLQKLNTVEPTDSTAPDSTSSGNGCACSTHSAGLCRQQDEFVAV